MWSNSPGWPWKKVLRIDIGDIPYNRRMRKRGKKESGNEKERMGNERKD